MISILKIYFEGNVVWLGASDWSIEGVWVWEPHGPPMNYTHWAEGRPNNRGGENCLLIDGSLNTHHSYKWDDRGCGNLFCSVCEMMQVDTNVCVSIVRRFDSPTAR